MTLKVYATNAPDTELEVDEAEFLDLARQGLLVPGKGDINANGRIKRQTAADAPAEVVTATTSPAYASPSSPTA